MFFLYDFGCKDNDISCIIAPFYKKSYKKDISLFLRITMDWNFPLTFAEENNK